MCILVILVATLSLVEQLKCSGRCVINHTFRFDFLSHGKFSLLLFLFCLFKLSTLKLLLLFFISYIHLSEGTLALVTVSDL